MRRRCCRCGLYRLDGLRHVCGSISAAWLLRRAAEQLPTLCAHVAPARCCPFWPWACCRVAPVLLLRCGPGCRPSRSPPAPRGRRPPGSCPPAASVAAVIRRGPLSRCACYDCNNYIDLHYILYLQYCTIRHDYKPFAHCIRWSIWHFFREFLGSESLVNQRFAGHLSLRGLREKNPYVIL